MSELHAFLYPLWVVWMVALFVGIVAWAMWPNNREHFERCARIPFEGENENGR